MKYKIGQQVRIKEHKKVNCGYGCAIWIDAMDKTIGKKAKILSIKNGIYFLDIDNEYYGYSDCMLEEVSDMYKQGDILIDKDGNKRKVLGVCGEVHFMSDDDEFERFENGYTKQELDKEGYKLFKEEDEEVAEAIKLLKEKGKIKDGKILEE